MDALGYSVETREWDLGCGGSCWQVCGGFSQFIAPTYKHDRCERSVQMHLYTLNKRQFVVVFATFFSCFAVSILIGLAGPPITFTTYRNASELVPAPTNLMTGPFIIKSPPVSTFHQQLWLIAQLKTNNRLGGSFANDFLMSIQVRGVLDEKNSDSVYSGGQTNHSQRLRCAAQSCDDVILLHLGYIDYPSYVITVNFYGLEKLQQKFVEVKFLFKSFNPSFTQLEIWFRFVFLVLTFIATVAFAHSLRRFSMRDWSIEQKWMSVLLPLLLLYNNPIFPLTFLVNSWVPGMLDACFQATYLCALLLFWLCLYHGVRQTKRHFVVFYAPKLILVGALWLTSVVMATWHEYKDIADPTYYYRLDSGSFTTFKVFFFVFGAIYVMYLIFLLVRAYAELRTMPYFDLRLKFMTALMFIVLVISILIMVLRFGSSALRSNFVAELSTSFQNSAEFLSFYGLLNFYMYTMAFVYSPSKNAVYESHFKDNPALSMLNDSDDEVVYGSSEHEEVTSLSRKSHNRYDSEEEFN